MPSFISPLVYSIPSQDGSFLLYAYAEKYQQKSQAGILGNKHNQGAFPTQLSFWRLPGRRKESCSGSGSIHFLCSIIPNIRNLLNGVSHSC